MRTRVFISGLALAMVAVACGGASSGELVATVNGEEITEDEVLELISVPGDTVDNEIFLRTLRSLIVDRALIELANAEFGVEVSDAQVDASVEELIGPLTEGGVAREDILASNNLTEAGLRAIAAQRVLQQEVEAALLADIGTPPDEELMQRYNASLGAESNVCSSHILLETEEDAQAALDRALAGEDFAALAMELSTGPSGPNGGDLGCGAPGGFVATFANATLEADVGVPFGPVETEFGFHVLLVSERTVPTFESMRDDLIAAMAAERGQDLWSTWLVNAIADVDVTVEPEYGTWTTEPVPQIIPPAP